MTKTLFLYLDGFCYDYLKKTPFLKQLSEKGISGNLKVVPLHQFEFSIMSGLSPLNHNLWIWYYYNPQDSPYKWLRYFNWSFQYLDSKALRTVITYLTSLILYLKGRTHFLKIFQIPLRLAPNFSITAQKSYIDQNPMSVPMLFDILRQNKINFLAVEWPLVSNNGKITLRPQLKSDQRILEYLAKKVKSHDFLFGHLCNLDSLMHRFGTKASEVFDYLKRLDENIKKLVEKFLAQYPDGDILVCSDHGMVDLAKTVDIADILENTGLKEGKDYLAFIGSMDTRIWLLTENTTNLEILKQALAKVDGGKVYDKFTIEKLGVSYKRELCGDLMFVCQEGIQLKPNYFDGYNISKAMHGYPPVSSAEDALMIIYSAKISPDKFTNGSLLDVLSTVLDLLDLPLPNYCQGKSWLD